MRVAFDTNIILDSALDRADRDIAQELIMAVANERIEGVVSANSVTDIYYIARKYIGDEAARGLLRNVLTLFDIVEVNVEVCSEALESFMTDFEDAVLAFCAKRAGADYIVSRDEGFLRTEYSPLKVKRPAEILEMIK